MAQDSEKKFLSIMDKLFHAPKSVPHSYTFSSSGEQLSGSKKRSYESRARESNLKGDVADGQQPSSAPAGAPQVPFCRPWDRGDFMKRLATFKSISWFAKPKVVSAVNCARRGWTNVDIDTIACEACGARLLFSTPASWNRHQVEKAALVFSLKLDNGHKLLCPWINNACDETLTKFPPTPPPVLVDKFKERCSALLQISALPRISSSAVEFIKSPLLEDFLGHSSMLEGGNVSANNTEIENLSSQHELKLYYQAQKLISLFGWTPRWLPYQVDCKDISNQSTKNIVANMKNNSLNVHSAKADESFKTDENSKYSSVEQMDPNSVVLDCSLCGATVGLWAFHTVPRPVELFRLVGYTEINVENHSENSFLKDDHKNRGCVSDFATWSKNSLGLNMTIAGGPLPTKQNFKATISFPVIGQNLWARLSYDSDFRDPAFVDGDGIQSDLQKRIRLQEKSDCTVDASSSKDMIPTHVESDGLKCSATLDPTSSQKDLTEGKALSVAQETLGVQLGNLENYGVRDTVENPVNCEDVNCSIGKDLRLLLSDKAMEFDPIRQHRHFCPWIASMNDDEPGWKQTLSALYLQKNQSHSSPHRSPSSASIVKVDDPIGSVRKLFMSPSTRRMKLPRVAGNNTEQR